MRISRMEDLGGNLAAGESVDVDFAAVGAGSRAGQGLQLILQLVGIVGEGIEVLALDHDGVGVVIRTGVDRGGFGI